jgi:Ser/Thr protein kinase RdoA (MazF antagonist)
MWPEVIVQHFALPAVHTVTPVRSGLLHATYRVVTVGGEFVVQRLHTAIPDSAVDDMRMVTAYLVSCGLQVPSLVSTLDGRPFVRDTSGGRWRVYPWLPGHVVESVPAPAMAGAAGRLVGLLHKHLAACDYIPQGSIPHFHDTDFVLTELQNVHPQLSDDVRGIADGILATLPSLIVADEPQQLIHGDLKISNLIFDDLGHAVGISDFDTILRHARAIDLGDAFRSWCNRTAEDDPDARFDITFFEAAASGYAQDFGVPAGPQERARHLRATK